VARISKSLETPALGDHADNLDIMLKSGLRLPILTCMLKHMDVSPRFGFK
jgi:hypothetical protein